MEDSFLIAQVIGGDRAAFKFLVLRYQRPVFRFLRGFNLEAHVIEELAQETFVRAYENIGRYSPERGASFGTWVFQIAKNLALNELSRSRRACEVPEDSVAGDAMADGRASPPALAEARESSLALGAAMIRLPEPFRSAVLLSCLQELSIEEVARIENCSPGTVKSRVFRGKQLLRGLLTGFSEA